MTFKVKVYVLGTGSAIVNDRRDNSSILILLDEKPVLIDIPGSPNKKIEQLGINSLSVDTILITHAHIDHIYGFPSLLHNYFLRLKNREPTYKNLNLRTFKLTLYASQESMKKINELYKVFGFNQRKGMFEIKKHILRNIYGSFTLWNDWKVTYVNGYHGSVKNIGYIFENRNYGIKIAYSGDSEPSEKFIKKSRGSDLLIHDCQTLANSPSGHSDVKKIISLLEKYELPKILVPIHMDGTEKNIGNILAKALKKNLKTKYIIPDDGELIYKV